MGGDPTSVDQWQSLSHDSLRGFIALFTDPTRRESLKARQTVLPVDISPVRLYAFLKARFGEPIGPMMAVRAPVVDNLVQWDFLVEDQTFFIGVTGLNHRLELRLYSLVDFPEPDWPSIVMGLRQAMSEVSDVIDATIAKFERWHLVLNPHARLVAVGNELVERLDRLGELPTIESTFFATSRPQGEIEEAVRKHIAHARELMSLATSIGCLAPVVGEAGVNVLITMLAHDSIRNDQRILDSTLRANIDVRVRKMHVDCRYFRKPIDGGDQLCKDFFRLMSKRNSILHGNITTKKEFGEDMFFDQRTIALPVTQRPLFAVVDDHIAAQCSPADAKKDFDLSKSFVSYVVDHLEDDVKDEMRMMLNELHLGFRPSENRFGLILPRAFTDIIQM